MLSDLKKYPLVPIFFHADAAYSQNVAQACYAGGIRFFEFTNRGPEAFEVFHVLENFIHSQCPGMALGIGTIYAPEDAERFIRAGADFVVQPVTTSEVAAVCKKYHKPWIPGAMTLNEIWSAWQMGATAVKIFPGNLVGPGYIRALRGPMPDVPLMITGGVEPTEESIGEWLGAGVQAVGLGSQLFKGDYSDDYSALTERVALLVSAIKG